MSDLIATTIRELPLFKPLSEEWLNRLCENATLRQFAVGEHIIDEGKMVDELFVVAAGTVRVWTKGLGKDVELKQLGPGNYVGEVSLLSGKTATATVEAAETTSIVAIGRTAIISLVESEDSVRKVLEGVTLARAKDTLGKVLQ
ncbi:MAG: cyclic nucleotide-binding domain-containing protein [bacterium]